MIAFRKPVLEDTHISSYCSDDGEDDVYEFEPFEESTDEYDEEKEEDAETSLDEMSDITSSPEKNSKKTTTRVGPYAKVRRSTKSNNVENEEAELGVWVPTLNNFMKD